MTSGIISALVRALALKKSDCSILFWKEYGSQYISVKFGSAVKSYGVKQEFIHYHILEQSGHEESFHKSLKKNTSDRATLSHSKIMDV